MPPTRAASAPASQDAAARLRRVDCTEPGRGSWKVLFEPRRRRFRVRHSRTGSAHIVFYGTRTERTMEGAEEQATALCAVLNALKAKRV